jgi:hypothetical protein
MGRVQAGADRAPLTDCSECGTLREALCAPPKHAPHVQDAKAAAVECGAAVCLFRDAGRGVDQHLTTARGQPDAVAWRPAHVLQPPRCRAVVWLPVLLARSPSHVKVATAGHSHIVARRAACNVGEAALVVGSTTDACGVVE